MERIELDKDVKPISEFRANATNLIEQVNKTKRPLVITQHGKSSAVLLDVKEYEALLDKIELLSDLAEAEEDIKNKRVYSTDKVREMLGKRTKK
ncbi:MAG TPA: type II toxin-antitoxin system Phd/YefM family antitoxin [Fibrobacteria bacterium]|nr:type II toxin-antitoxin system Phd/YefM family antitoxin [Fibrobacteria bacterium]